MKNIHRCFNQFFSILITFLLASCAPDIYKNEVAIFSTSVNDTTTAFEELRQRQLEVQRDLAFSALAENRAELGPVGEDCGDELAFLEVDDQLICMREWAEYRAVQSTGLASEPPTCVEPARDAETGEPTYFSFADLANSQIKSCSLGVATTSATLFDREPLDAAEELLPQTAELLPPLAQYGRALSAIVDAKDQGDLRSAAGNAKDAIEDSIEQANETFGDDISTSAIGPVSDLLGEVLMRGLEYRRWLALKNITTDADPIINRISAILSRSLATLELNELQTSGAEYRKTISLFNDKVDASDKKAWKDGYINLKQLQKNYLDLYKALIPTSIFETMATAHHALVNALEDPSLQFDNLQQTIAAFREKAKAAKSAFGSGDEEQNGDNGSN